MRNDYDVDDDDDWDLNYQRAKPSNQIDGTFLSKTFFNLISRFCYWKKEGKMQIFVFFCIKKKSIEFIHYDHSLYVWINIRNCQYIRKKAVSIWIFCLKNLCMFIIISCYLCIDEDNFSYVFFHSIKIKATSTCLYKFCSFTHIPRMNKCWNMANMVVDKQKKIKNKKFLWPQWTLSFFSDMDRFVSLSSSQWVVCGYKIHLK